MTSFDKAIKDTADYLSCGMSCQIHKTDFTVIFILDGDEMDDYLELEDDSEEIEEEPNQHYFL